MTTGTEVDARERADFIDALGHHRGLLLQTIRGLSDEQAALRTTTSELCLGGILKHLARMEGRWADFIEHGAASMPLDQAAMEEHAASFRLLPGETLAGLVDHYSEAARRTDALVGALESLDASHALPPAPWFEPGARWSARRVLLHLLAETAQHAGHADIVRESLDGARTMG